MKLKKAAAVFTAMLTLMGAFSFAETSDNISDNFKIYANEAVTETYGDLSYIQNGSTINIIDCQADATYVVIPEVIDSCTVTKISDGAFKDCTKLVGVVIPETVTSIGLNTFEGCTLLSDVTLPESVPSISGYMFKDCTSLEEINIPETVTSIGFNAFENCTALKSLKLPEVLSTIGSSAFRNCTTMTEAVIPDNVLSIGDSAYEGCTALAKVKLGNKLKVLGGLAFADCKALEKMFIPKSVTTIGDGIFRNSLSMTSLVVEDGNSKFTSYENVLFNSDKTKLICYPAGKANLYYTCPKTLVEISPYAFYGNLHITEITLPNTLTTVGEYAFNNDEGNAYIEKIFCNEEINDLLNMQTETGKYIGVGKHIAYNYKECYSLAPESLNYAQNYYAFSFDTNYSMGKVIAYFPIEYLDDINYASLSYFEGLKQNYISAKIYEVNDDLAAIEVNINKVMLDNFNIIFHDEEGMPFIPLEEIEIYLDKDESYDPISISAYFSSYSEIDIDTDIDIEMYYNKIINSEDIINSDNTSILPNTSNATKHDKIYANKYDSNYGICGADTTATSIIMPDKIDRLPVTAIEENAFFGCRDLENVVISENVATIGKTAFYQNCDLESVVIPYSVSEIAEGAFDGCTDLKDVYYNGSEEEWNAITIGIDNECLTNATIHFNSDITTMRGDLNGDCYCDFADVAIMQDYLAKKNDEILSTADLNGDGSLNVFDLALIKRIVADNV